MSVEVSKATVQVVSGPPVNTITLTKATMQVVSNPHDTPPSPPSGRRRQIIVS